MMLHYVANLEMSFPASAKAESAEYSSHVKSVCEEMIDNELVNAYRQLDILLKQGRFLVKELSTLRGNTPTAEEDLFTKKRRFARVADGAGEKGKNELGTTTKRRVQRAAAKRRNYSADGDGSDSY